LLIESSAFFTAEPQSPAVSCLHKITNSFCGALIIQQILDQIIRPSKNPHNVNLAS
jgi:hypothetical protein